MRTELHFHLLPAVDDGPRDPSEALALARAALADGTRRIITTPHVCEVVVDELPDRVAALDQLLGDAGLPLEVGTGGELGADDVASLSDEQLELIAQGPADRRWLLLEAPLVPSVCGYADAAEEVRARGYGVLMGHPERSPSTSLADVEAQIALGSVLQLNASSLTGLHGGTVRSRAHELARSGLPFVVSSDAHSPQRPPLLSGAERALREAGLPQSLVTRAVDTGAELLLAEGLAAHAAAETVRR